ncbi:hypothetical protein EMIT0111MI5_150003 [Burkholderia sp. IT-111MI5]
MLCDRATRLRQFFAQSLAFEHKLIMLIFRYSNGFSYRLVPRPKCRLALRVRHGVGLSWPAPATFFRYGTIL